MEEEKTAYESGYPSTPLPKYYATACTDRPSDYYDYKNLIIPYGYFKLDYSYRNIEEYEIARKLGVGRYADVYEGVNVDNGKKVAIKILKPIRKEKINREIKVMMALSGSTGIPKYLDIVKDVATKTTSIVISSVLTVGNGIR